MDFGGSGDGVAIANAIPSHMPCAHVPTRARRAAEPCRSFMVGWLVGVLVGCVGWAGKEDGLD